MKDHRLLLISRDDILRASEEKYGKRLFPLLAQFTRHNFHLLSTAPQPDSGFSIHGGPDGALLGPNSIHNRLSDAGGILDGVYYVPRSLMTQKRNREQALQDMLQRFATSPDHCHLLSSSKKFVNAANEQGIHGTHLNKNRTLINELKTLSDNFFD